MSEIEIVLRQAGGLHRAQALARQHQGKIGGAGQIVGNTSKQHSAMSLQ